MKLYNLEANERRKTNLSLRFLVLSVIWQLSSERCILKGYYNIPVAPKIKINKIYAKLPNTIGKANWKDNAGSK